MAHTKAHYDFEAPQNPSNFAAKLGLTNLGISIYVFGPGEGFDFFHNHREQEEVYLCLDGTAALRLGGDDPQTVALERGDIVRVDAQTLRAVGNDSAGRAVVLIAGACPHPYPAGIGHHDVIADVLSIVGKGSTGFTMPAGTQRNVATIDDLDC